MTFIILIMWLLADIGIFRSYSFSWHDRNFKYIDATDGYTYSVIETYYGLGKTLYYSRKLDVVTDSIKPKIHDDDWEEGGTEISLGQGYSVRLWWVWWAERLPGFRLGWLLAAFFVIIYILLIRKSAKNTQLLAQPIKQNRPSILHMIYPEKRPGFEKTRTLVNPRAIYVFLGITLFISVFFLCADIYLVFIDELPRTFEFGYYSKVDASFRNFEYILPSIVYLVASIISAFCIVKYIKAVKNHATQSNDISLN